MADLGRRGIWSKRGKERRDNLEIIRVLCCHVAKSAEAPGFARYLPWLRRQGNLAGVRSFLPPCIMGTGRIPRRCHFLRGMQPLLRRYTLTTSGLFAMYILADVSPGKSWLVPSHSTAYTSHTRSCTPSHTLLGNHASSTSQHSSWYTSRLSPKLGSLVTTGSSSTLAPTHRGLVLVRSSYSSTDFQNT